jgi:hypothetical protein
MLHCQKVRPDGGNGQHNGVASHTRHQRRWAAAVRAASRHDDQPPAGRELSAAAA